MVLPAETPLGPYQILEPIRAGGIGEVCRSRHTRLRLGKRSASA
jgi:hypothetical protein